MTCQILTEAGDGLRDRSYGDHVPLLYRQDYLTLADLQPEVFHPPNYLADRRCTPEVVGEDLSDSSTDSSLPDLV